MEEEQLRQLRTALQASIPNSEECGVLTGYVVISQWTDNKGDDWLMTTAGDINDRGANAWAIKGWLAHSLDHLYDHFSSDED